MFENKVSSSLPFIIIITVTVVLPMSRHQKNTAKSSQQKSMCLHKGRHYCSYLKHIFRDNINRLVSFNRCYQV